MTTITNIFDLEQLAREAMLPMFYDYYAGGAGDELTVHENTEAYKRLKLAPRMLRGVGERSMNVELFGQTFSTPIAIAPTALQRLAHPEGELATARAAARAGALMILSTTSTYSLEEVAATSREVGGTLWFQLYVFKDRAASRDLVQRAEHEGCKALVLTADTPMLGKRERDIRNGFHLPPDIQTKNYSAIGATSVDTVSAGSGLSNHFFQNIDASLTWKDVEWLCSITNLPVLVKGVMRADDALQAARHGASGIVVSNHGGRQLDTSAATIEVLPQVVAAVRSSADSSISSLEILVDGGIRRGTDVLKALALGAKAVLLGRPILWGLAADGERGVETALHCIRDEFDNAMAISGCRTLHEITSDLLFHP